MSTTKQLEAAGTSIASNIGVQVLSRGFTFILGAVTLKYLQSSALLGIINVRLALLYTTLQFLSREPFRRACLGEVAKKDSRTWQKILNTIWLSLILAVSLAIPLSYIWRLNTPSTDDLMGTTVEDYSTAVLIICLAVIIEMFNEPCYIYAQAKAIVEHNPKVEVASVTTKCILTALVTVMESNKYKTGESLHIITKLATCQLIASSGSVIYSYYKICNKTKLSPMKFLPSTIHPKKSDNKESFIYRMFDENCLKLSMNFVSQTFLKQLLTEGERFIMTFFNVISLSEQGIYDVVNNLGSLAARLIFKPIEDSGYTLFSQSVSRTETLDIRRFYRVQENLMFLIRSMFLLGVIVLTFGYNFVPLIVIYGGEKLNNQLAFRLMRWQLFYIPFLAVNGVTECFTFATMNSREIKTYNICMIIFSLIYLISIYTTQSTLGSASFIFANCLIMVSRILFSVIFISKYFNKHGYQLKIQEALPSLTTAISLSGVFTFLSISQHYLLDLSQPLSVTFGLILGSWCFVFVIHVILCHEEELVDFVSRLFKIKSFSR